MGSEWEIKRLGSIVNFRRGHDLPRTKMNELGKIPVLGSNGIIGYHDEYTCSDNCLVIGRSGNVGTPFLIESNAWAHNTTLYIDDFKGNNIKFIYYLLKTLNLGKYGGGSAVPTLNRNHIHPLEVKIPPTSEQKAIANILGTLDDKIELNRKMNETLEEMAQALFKSWFVDFDPVLDKALAAGHEIPEPLKVNAEKRKVLGDKRKALPQEIADLFPDRFVFREELGWVPEGWELKKINGFGNVVTGNTPPSKNPEYYGDDILFITPSDFNNYIKIIDKAARGLSFQGKEKFEKKLLKPNSILVTCIGSDMGKVAINRNISVSNQQINSIVPENIDLHTEYLYYSLKNKYELLRQIAFGGSTMPIINKSDFGNITLLSANEEVLGYFSKQVSSLTTKIEINSHELNNLAKLRDTLLPKLISGELRVPEVEKMAVNNV